MDRRMYGWSEVNAWVLERGNWAEGGGVAGLGAGRRGDRAGNGPGVPRSGRWRAGPAACVLACMCACCPGPHASV